MRAKFVVSADMIRGVHIAGLDGRYDISLEGARISALTPSDHTNGGVITPLLADVHLHLDKTYTFPRIASNGPAKVECLFDAIELMSTDRAHWTADDIHIRASRALEAAYAQGVGAIRTHVDWTEAGIPTAWHVLSELRQEWADRIDVQMAALVHGDIVLESGSDIASRVSQDGGVFGAFFYRNTELTSKIGEMFRLADKHDLDLDFHVDEGLEAEADGFSLIVNATKQTGMYGRVLCGHACSLSLREPDELKRILNDAAQAGVALVSLPTTNLYLQDRLGGKSPRMRGIAPLKEARRAGMKAMIASDNVGDAFYPYGDYDPLGILRLAAPACHLEPDDWLDSITTLPAEFIKSNRVKIPHPGGDADFIWHDAENLIDLISRPQAQRVIWRKGLASNDLNRRNP